MHDTLVFVVQPFICNVDYMAKLAFLSLRGMRCKCSTLPFVTIFCNMYIWIVPSFWIWKPTSSTLNISSQGSLTN